MKKLLFILAVAGCTMSPLLTQAQSFEEAQKERAALRKASKAELNEKATKAARQEAKKLTKAGWLTAPGALPIDRQLDRSYLMQYQFDEDQYPKFIMAEAMSIGENYDGAKMQALELAKQNLAGQIQTEVTTLVESTVANGQLTAEEAATVTKSVAASKSLFSQRLGRVIPVVEVYRTLKNKNKEVLVRIAYNMATARAMVKQAVREDLERQGDNLHKDLDSKLGW
ncbi:MAG: hypothetical protein MR516_08000 [Bacteroidales bacterium]|nr:hypothetical protein [Bacteroidales bacterium]MEE0903549.1 hypothetical protein [Prevotellamassilia sp.]